MPHAHDEYAKLLPWFVNGTLDGEEMAGFEKHLDDCADCVKAVAAEFELARQLQLHPKGFQTLVEYERHAAQRLLAGLNDAGHSTANTSTPGAKLHLWQRQPLASAAALVLGTAIGLFAGLNMQPDSEYIALNDAITATQGGQVIQVVFQPTISERELRLLLLDGEAQLLGSPSRKGVYRVQLPTQRDAAVYARRLQQHPGIRLVELERL